MLPSYRSQSSDLLWKSIDWFLYEGNTGTWWVNAQPSFSVDFFEKTFTSDVLECQQICLERVQYYKKNYFNRFHNYFNTSHASFLIYLNAFYYSTFSGYGSLFHNLKIL